MQCFNQFLLFSCPTLKRIPYFCNAVERKEDRLTEKRVFIKFIIKPLKVKRND